MRGAWWTTATFRIQLHTVLREIASVQGRMVQSGPHGDLSASHIPSDCVDRLRRMSGDGGRGARTFLASFLVLFLEIALIRWMPAYIRLLSYFSNFILLASFLGIGLGCLLAPARTRLFNWFPLLQAIVIGAVNYFRLEVSVATSGSI